MNMTMMRNRKTGEEMSVRDFASKMLNDVCGSHYKGDIDILQFDRYLWEVEDFCNKNGLYLNKKDLCIY